MYVHAFVGPGTASYICDVLTLQAAKTVNVSVFLILYWNIGIYSVWPN